jgi:hypothetical protein
MPSPNESIFETRLDWYIEQNDSQSGQPGEERIFIGNTPAEGGVLYSSDSLYLGVPPFAQLLPARSEVQVFENGRIGNVHGKVPIHELVVADFRRLPRYLTDAVLKPDRVLVPGDHYLYWAWSGAFFRYLTGKHPAGSWMFHSAGPPPGMQGVPHTSSESRPSKYGPHVWGEKYKPVLEDFFTLLHMMLLPVREVSKAIEARAQLYSLNPSFLGVQKDLGFKFATGSGFSVLEGLLRRRCDPLNEDGILKPGHGPINLPHTTLNAGQRVYLFEALLLWKQHTAGPLVEQTLSEIDDVTRYDVTKLTQKFGGLSQTDLSHGGLPVDSLLKGIKEQRNYNIHGEDSTMAIGAIVLTLCCLILWDELNESNIQYDRSKVNNPSDWPDPATYTDECDNALHLIEQHQQMLDNGYWSVPTDAAGLPRDRLTPRIFYPIQTTMDPFGLDLEW